MARSAPYLRLLRRDGEIGHAIQPLLEALTDGAA
jgi:hypothetical protein